MTNFLLELRSEEIPARMQDKARGDLARLFVAELGKAGIVASDITTYATPRRLTLIARGSGQPYEDAWRASSATVTDRLPGLRDSSALLASWQDYTKVHTQVRALDDGGSWDDAVGLATG